MLICRLSIGHPIYIVSGHDMVHSTMAFHEVVALFMFLACFQQWQSEFYALLKRERRYGMVWHVCVWVGEGSDS